MFLRECEFTVNGSVLYGDSSRLGIGGGEWGTQEPPDRLKEGGSPLGWETPSCLPRRGLGVLQGVWVPRALRGVF